MILLLLPLIGIGAGGLTTYLSKGHRFGVYGNVALGVWGAIVGRLLFELLGLGAYSLIGSLLLALVGALAGQSLVILIETA